MADSLPTHGRLNAKNPYVGFFKHAPRGQDPYANRVLEGQHTPEADIIRARALRRSVYSGTFHTGPGQYKGLHGRYLPKFHSITHQQSTTIVTPPSSSIQANHQSNNTERVPRTEPPYSTHNSRSSSISTPLDRENNNNNNYKDYSPMINNSTTTPSSSSTTGLRISTVNLSLIRDSSTSSFSSSESAQFINRLRTVKTAIADLNSLNVRNSSEDYEEVRSTESSSSHPTTSIINSPLSDAVNSRNNPKITDTPNKNNNNSNNTYSLPLPSRRQSLPSSPMMASLLISSTTSKMVSPTSPRIRSHVPAVLSPPSAAFTTIGKGKVTGDNASLFLDPLNNFAGLVGRMTAISSSFSSSLVPTISSSSVPTLPTTNNNYNNTILPRSSPSSSYPSSVPVPISSPSKSVSIGDKYEYHSNTVSPVIRSSLVDYTLIEPLQSVVTIGRHSIKKSTRSSMDENEPGTPTDNRFLPTTSPVLEPIVPNFGPSTVPDLNESLSSELSVDTLISSHSDQYGELSPYHFVSTSWLTGGGIGVTNVQASSTSAPLLGSHMPGIVSLPHQTTIKDDENSSLQSINSLLSSVNINPAVPLTATSIIGRHTQVITNSIASYGINYNEEMVASVPTVASKDTPNNPSNLTVVPSLPSLSHLSVPESLNLSFHPDIFTTELEAVSPIVGKGRLKTISSKKLRNLSTGNTSSIPEQEDTQDNENDDEVEEDIGDDENNSGSDGKEGFAFTIGSHTTTNPKSIESGHQPIGPSETGTVLLLPPAVGARNSLIIEDYEIGKIIGEGGYAQVRIGLRKENHPTPSLSNNSNIVSSNGSSSSALVSGTLSTANTTTVLALESYYHSNANTAAINVPPIPIPTQVVIKCIRKRFLISEEERDSVAREVVIHRSLDTHPRIVTLYDVYEQTNNEENNNGNNRITGTVSTSMTKRSTPSSSVPLNFGNNLVCLILEYVPGGTLADYMRAKSVRAFSEWQARLIIDNLLEALEYLHGRGILHGDIKPSNLLIAESVLNTMDTSNSNNTNTISTTSSTNGTHNTLSHYRRQTSGFSTTGAPLISYIDGVKLCDFGNARRSRDARYYRITGDVSLVPYTTISGTVGYISPEILQRQPYGTPADIWSTGIILYELLAGYAPFHPYSLCLTNPPSFNHPPWTSNGISPEAISLCKAMLTMDTHKRITAHAARAHPWFSEGKI